jgi:hypothetical protein
MVMLDKNEVKKDLFKSKAMAKFSHYISGSLYYTVEVLGDVYQFPISTVDRIKWGDEETSYMDTYHLSGDLGTTDFRSEIKGSELSRWIAKAIDQNEFIKVG